MRELSAQLTEGEKPLVFFAFSLPPPLRGTSLIRGRLVQCMSQLLNKDELS